MDDLDDIKVALTSTKFVLASEDPKLLPGFKDFDVPVCCADMELPVLMIGRGQEAAEHLFSQTCKDMAKIICIDPEKRYVFIGMDPAEEETGLIVYTEELKTPATTNFFDRWNITKQVLLEFRVFINKKLTFCLRGLWDKDHWYSLEIYPTSNLTVVGMERN